MEGEAGARLITKSNSRWRSDRAAGDSLREAALLLPSSHPDEAHHVIASMPEGKYRRRSPATSRAAGPNSMLGGHHHCFVRRGSSALTRTRGAGRPPEDAKLCALIVKLANDNPTWGAPRIHGEPCVQRKNPHRGAVRQVRENVAQQPHGQCWQLGLLWPHRNLTGASNRYVLSHEPHPTGLLQSAFLTASSRA